MASKRCSVGSCWPGNKFFLLLYAYIHSAIPFARLFRTCPLIFSLTSPLTMMFHLCFTCSCELSIHTNIADWKSGLGPQFCARVPVVLIEQDKTDRNNYIKVCKKAVIYSIMSPFSPPCALEVFKIQNRNEVDIK